MTDYGKKDLIFRGLNMDKPLYRLKIPTAEEVTRYLSYYGLEPEDMSIIGANVQHYLVLKSKKFGHICGLVAVLPDGTEYQIDLYLNEQ